MENINTSEYWDKKIDYIERNKLKINGGEERRKLISKFIKPNSLVLDIGCGAGDLLEYLDKLGIGLTLYGADISSVALFFANQKIPKAKFIQNNGQDRIELDNMDVIVMSHVLEHVDNPAVALKKWSLSLKRNGIIIILLPLNDRTWIEHLHKFTSESAENLFKTISDDYEIIIRPRGIKYKDETPMMEIVGIIKK